MNEITRPLEIIETEIIFYKQQTATGIIEIGKRLIEAKSQLQHGDWGKWLEEKVSFSNVTASRFMKAANELSNISALQDLPQTKVFALLELPEETRQAVIQNAPLEVTKEEYMSAQKVKLNKHLAKYFPEELEKGA